MSIKRYLNLKRKNIFKLILFSLILYLTYVFLAAFGKIGGIVEDDKNSEHDDPKNHPRIPRDNKPNDYDVKNNNVNIGDFDKNDLDRIRNIIDKHDTFKNYDKIKENGLLII